MRSIRITKAVIPVAGLGTRLLPLSKSVPKELLPVGNKPCLQWVVEELYDAGIREILFVVGEEKRHILQHFKDDNALRNALGTKTDPILSHALDYLDLDLTYHSVVQKPLRGLGHAITFAREFTAQEPFIVALGDAVIQTTKGKSVTKRLISSLENGDAFAVAVRRVDDEDISKCGVVVLAGNRTFAVKDAEREGRAAAQTVGDSMASIGMRQRTAMDQPMLVRSLIEKPASGETSSRLAISGRYVFRNSIYSALDSICARRGGELQLTDAMNLLVQHGYRGNAVMLSEHENRYDVGNHRDYLRAMITYSLTVGPYADEMRDYAAKLLARGMGSRY